MRSRESEESSEEVRRGEKEITLLEAFHALALWLFDTSPLDKVDAIFGKDIHPTYREEKVDMALTGFAGMWGSLDPTKRKMLIEAVIDKYGEEARNWTKRLPTSGQS